MGLAAVAACGDDETQATTFGDSTMTAGSSTSGASTSTTTTGGGTTTGGSGGSSTSDGSASTGGSSGTATDGTGDSGSTGGGAFCGDANVDPGEDCDDGNQVDDDDCTNMCVSNLASKVVFVTSTLQTGNMGGLAGADQICQQLATAAGLGGTFLAWLSDATTDPGIRFMVSTDPYVLADGTMVALDFTDLADGNLLHPIDQTETGGAVPLGTATCDTLTLMDATGVFTNTQSSGTGQGGGQSCGGWTSTSGVARFGAIEDPSDGFWSVCGIAPCSLTAPIYCFEQ